MSDQSSDRTPASRTSASNSAQKSESKAASPVVSKLAAACEGLLMTSENDYPFAAFFLESEAEKNAKLAPTSLPKRLDLKSEAPIAERSLDDFLADASTEEDWMEDEEKANAKKFKALLAALKSELQAPTVYLFGARKLDAVVIGRVEGGFAGLTTQIVET